MKISIFAAVWAKNLWDELIIKNEIKLLKQEFLTDVQFQIASYDPENPVFQIEDTSYFEYFPIGIKNPKNILRNIKNFFKFLRVIIWSDIVVIWGGGIIYDNELQSVRNPLDQWIFRTKIARLFRKKIYFYAVGIDIKQLGNYEKLEKIFKAAWKVTVRDEKSLKQLADIGVDSTLVDDPVISENTNSGKIYRILSSKNFSLKDFDDIDFSEVEVALALRSGYIGKSGKSQIEALMISELCEMIEKKWGRIIFLPHSIHPNDEQANDYTFMKQFVTPNRKICENLWEIYTWYQENDNPKLLISMRLHSIILWYVYGIPQIVLSYSQKTDEIIKKLS